MRKSLLAWNHAFPKFAFLLLLASCGGGGGGGGGSTPSYTVGGAVSGLTGTVVLQDNGGDNLSLTANAAFTFATPVADGAAYSVAVLTQPSGQTCSVGNNAGTIPGANVTNVSVACSTLTYTVGGTISGLTLTGSVVLRDNGGDDLPLSASGSFTFATPVAYGALYSVTVLSAQRPFQECSVSAGTGTISGNVGNVAVNCAVPHNLVFFTSTTHDGNLGANGTAALTAADGICNARATAGGLPGSYVAWLSTSIPAVNAKDRLGASRGWVRPDGLPFVDTVADLVASKILYPPRVDENGVVAGANVPVFTGTQPDGTASGGFTCTDWSSTGGNGAAGLADAGGSFWTNRNLLSCASAALYCFGAGSTAPLSFAPAAGRLAFISATVFVPSGGVSGGLSGADALCQSDAAAAGQAGTYKALLATTTASAASRFSTTGATWVRRDGVRVFASASDLAATKLLAPINVTAAGVYTGALGAWLGVSSFSAVGTAASTCSNWTSTASPFGNLVFADSSAPVANVVPCAGADRLLCLQQ